MRKYFNSIGEVSPPAEEPVTVAAMRSFLNLAADDDDELLGVLIGSARQYYESITLRATVSRTLIVYFDGFPSNGSLFVLPYSPLISVSDLKYIDTSGDEQTLSSDEYAVNASGIYGTVSEAFGKYWPSATRTVLDSVYITYAAGYAAAASVPSIDKNIIMMIAADLYEHRNAQNEQNLTPNSNFTRILNARTIRSVY